MSPLATISIGSADIDGTGSLGFTFILIFSHPSLCLSVPPSHPIFSYVPPIASSPLPILSLALLYVPCPPLISPLVG